MKKIIEEIKNNLEKLNRPSAKLLQKGIDRNEIEKKVNSLDLVLPSEFYTFFSLIDGINEKEKVKLGEIDFFPGYYLMSLNECISNYNLFKNDERWKKSWFPIFANGGGDFYCIVCPNTPAEKAPIVDYLLEEDDHIIVHSSLYNMLKTILDCYNEKVYYIDQEGYLEVDYDKELEIQIRNNS